MKSSFSITQEFSVVRNILRTSLGQFISVVGMVLLAFAGTALPTCAAEPEAATRDATAAKGEPSRIDTTHPKKHVAVLSSAAQPGADTSQGLYIEILRDAGFDARAISAGEVREKKLAGIDIFVIGGGSGTAFNKSLGPEGGKVVEDFVRRGGGALASCAGGYSFVIGHNEALKYIEIAQAHCIDHDDGRWARGSAEVEITPADERYRPLKMYYANGPLWEIVKDQGTDRTVALARFKDDVKKGDDKGGVMPGTPAILGGTYGEGRFVLFSAHPEFHKKLGNRPVLVDAAQWVTRGKMKPHEAIKWEEVFPSSGKGASVSK